MARWLTWISEPQRQGWACSQCTWSCDTPSLLTDADAKSAFDRLAAAKFQEHDCNQHEARHDTGRVESFADRARKLVTRGFKPKDAAEITLQELTLEYRNDKQAMDRARMDAEDFLRRVKEGLI